MFKRLFASFNKKKKFSKIPFFTPLIYSASTFINLEDQELKKELHRNITLQNFQKIRNLATKALEKNPNDLYLLVYLFMANLQLEIYDENIENQIENFSPKTPEEKYAKGIFLIYIGDQSGYEKIKEAAEENYPEAVLEMGRLYLKYDDLEKAKKNFKKAFNLGLDIAKVDIAVMLLNGDEPLKGVRLLEEMHDSNLFSNDFQLFSAYHNGIGVEKNTEKAGKYLKSSIEQGDSNAEHQLALISIQNKNYKDALYWASMASDKGNDTAKSLLANMLILGIGSKDVQLGFNILFNLSNANNLFAMKSLASFLVQGKYNPKDYNTAKILYEKCAGLGDDHCIFFLGMCFVHGIGVEKDVEKGKQIIRFSSLSKQIEMDKISEFVPPEWLDK